MPLLRTSFGFIAALASVLALSAPTSHATPVSPGESGVFVEANTDVTGTTLADESRDVTFTYNAPPGTSFDAEGNVTSRTQAATFNQRVVRDSTSDELVFVYSLTIPDADGPVESMQISASSFTDFTTDLQGDFGGSQAMQASRTADGATISGSVADGVAGQGGSFLSFTDADSFNADGSVVLRISNEFETFDAQGSSFGATGVVADLLTLSGTFQPFADAPPPNAIPLPAAVWPGAILLGAVGAKLRWSRRRDA